MVYIYLSKWFFTTKLVKIKGYSLKYCLYFKMKITIKWLMVSNSFTLIVLKYVDDRFKTELRIWWQHWPNSLITGLARFSVQYIFNAITHLQHTLSTYLSDGVTRSPLRDCLNSLQRMDANTKMKARSSSSWFLNDSHGSVSMLETFGF